MGKLYRCPTCTCSDSSKCKSRAALRLAIENGDSIHELEFVGVNHRTLSTLDDAGVIFLEQLLQMTQEDILQINSIGTTSLQQILQGLCEFNLVAPIRAKRERELYRYVAVCRRQFFEDRNFQYEPENTECDDDDDIKIENDFVRVFNEERVAV